MPVPPVLLLSVLLVVGLHPRGEVGQRLVLKLVLVVVHLRVSLVVPKLEVCPEREPRHRSQRPGLRARVPPRTLLIFEGVGIPPFLPGHRGNLLRQVRLPVVVALLVVRPHLLFE